ncbi:hypothetical protein [Thermomonas hydrothermalis]|uniref:Uncharacterized conserved protein YcfJ, contains glycine zipper 2TM domain n=1 Tax=Thermomonas hydrothermalis TaxID=213588 RepID=A0A1M4UP38_9GAMM|nr:hypothetical protein [Thermomonas hydrothermalis]SHE58353.1 Uncharacterized conserved protein YcfJ, contains glycine zipper 2TM domain [Thermomonas hydrothermalis]
MPVFPFVPTMSLAVALLATPAAQAQDQGKDQAPARSAPVENVRYDYAQVLAVRPVYETIKTTQMEKVCERLGPDKPNPLSRVVNAVRDRLSTATPEQATDCRMQPVTKESRRVVAYDVDYMYRGNKFRTRMENDPGYRLRIRISIMPHPDD